MSIEKRPNGVWRARISLPGGKQRSKHFAKRSDAARWEAEQYASLHRGNWVDPSDRTAVIDYARQWAASRPHRPTTARDVSSLIENHIAATPLGGRRLASVRPSEVQTWATDRSKVLGPLRLRNLVSMLRSMYRDAVLDRLCAENPVARVRLPRHDRPRVVPLTVDQVRALVDAIPERNRAMIITQAGLGLRIGELLALRVQDIDFLRRTARIEWQFAPQSHVRTEPKTPKSRRTIPLPRVVADALAAHIAAYPPLEDGTLFSNRQGGPYRHDTYGSLLFKRAVKRAGLPDHITTHDLRHHYASVLLLASESIAAVAERLGHENPTVTLQTYAHLMPGSDDRTRRAVDDAWSMGRNRDRLDRSGS